METVKNEAAEAARVEDEVKGAGLDFSSYTHKFRSPVTICGVEARELTFDYGALTGRDHIDAERSCLNGFKALSLSALESFPIGDYEAIRTSVRNFFIVSSL